MTAIDAFHEGVREVNVLLALSRRPEVAEAEPVSVTPGAEEQVRSDESLVDGPPAERAIGDSLSDQDNSVRRASVVLLVSHFESYLKSTAEEFIDSLSSGNLEARRIPVGIRELHTVPKIEEILSSKDAAQRHNLLRKLSAVSMLWNDTAKPAKGSLDARLFSRQVTSARPEKIDNLFELMGSTHSVCDGDIDIRVGDGETVTSNIRLALDDVVKCRNDIAHGDSSRKPTDNDVERYTEFLVAFAARLERRTQGLISSFAE